MIYLYVILGIAVVFLIDFNHQRTMKRDFLEKIRKQWGKPVEEQYSREELEQIAYRFNHDDIEMFLDDITWQDLDMDRLFSRMNNTGSSAGQEYLYYLLRTPVDNLEELKKRDAFINSLLEDESGREKLQAAFGRISKCKKGSLAGYMELLKEISPGSNRKHYCIILALVFSLGLMLFVDSALGMLALFVVLAYSIIEYYRCKASIEPYFICIRCVAAMSQCCKNIGKMQLPYVDNTKMAEYGRLFREESRKLKFISSGSDYNGSLLDTIYDYIRMITHIDIIMYNQIVSSFQEKQASIERMTEELGYMDAMIAIASFRCSLSSFTRPVLKNEKQNHIMAEEIYHPFIENPVKNSISVTDCVLVTGSNASGKSTFLRTMAINAILAQTIFTCTATRYESNFFRVYSSMSLRDDLLKGDSYYMVEIKAILRILLACKGRLPVLCFVDEVLRGTNTVERIAASTSILRFLREQGALCFAATHDIELTRLLDKEYDNYHFEETVTDEDISFNYCLQKGPAVTRNAIKLLKMMEYDEKIVNRAECMAEEFLKSGNWVLPGKE